MTPNFEIRIFTKNKEENEANIIIYFKKNLKMCFFFNIQCLEL